MPIRFAALLLAAALLAGCVPTSSAGATPAPGATLAPGGSQAAPGAGRPAGASGDPAPDDPTAGDSGNPSGPGKTPPPAFLLPSVSRVPPVPRVELDARLDDLREGLSIPGVSVAIRWDDGRVWLGSSGLADVEAATPVASRTAFSLASVSKTYTAAVALQLVEEGALGLEDRVAPWLPGLEIDGRITIRMLLEHTSGLTDFFLNQKIDKALQSEPDAAWTADRALTFLPPGGRPPGAGFRYSNTNYLLLGLLVEAATGAPLGDSVRTRLLAPLRLEDTWTQVAEPPRLPLARAYRLVRSGGTVVARVVAPSGAIAPFRSVVTAAGGAGGMAGTASDAARWMGALAAGEVLEPETMEVMLRVAETVDGSAPRIPYGLGVQLVRLGTMDAIGHSGRYLGVRSVVRYVPSRRLTIAVLTNQSSVDPVRIATSLLQIAAPRAVCIGCPEER